MNHAGASGAGPVTRRTRLLHRPADLDLLDREGASDGGEESLRYPAA